MVLLQPPARRRRPRLVAVPRDRRASTTGGGGSWSLVAATSPSSRCSLAVLVPGVGVDVNGSSRWLGLGSAAPAVGARQAGDAARRVPTCCARRQAWVKPARHGAAPGARAVRRRSPCCSWRSRTSARRSSSRRSSSPCCSAPACPGRCSPAGAASASALALLATLDDRLPPGPAARLPRPVGRPGDTGYQTIQSQVSLGVGRLARRRARRVAGPSGASCPTPTPTSSSPSSARSSAWSAPSSSSRCSSRSASSGCGPPPRRPTASACSLATGITAWFCVQAFVNIGAVDRHPADHRRAAAVHLLRRLGACWSTWPPPASSATSAATPQ